ncbi:unannotated protein [freshwater metagenome]|uniref:Unannotated protein n=1 Tax=freshwater metagenome TaxID=449393 RepID=A0A6J6H1B5_9ZZZZ|nr:DUF4239 domain-containing protein [Actinomycetota bacterium]
MTTLTSLDWWALFPLLLFVIATIAVVAHVVIRRFLGHHASRSVSHAAPLMPTLGALFAFLSAFVIATEWTAQSSADSTVAHIASASARLAWASTAPGAETFKIQDALSADLSYTVTTGWTQLQSGDEVGLIETESYRNLQKTVRDSAYSPAVSTPASNELLAAVDELGATRRDLANAAGRTLPTLLLAVLALSGIILTINAVILVVESPGRSSFVVLSVVVLVSFDLALLLVLAAPFRGTLQASRAPVESVVHEIDSGFFTR